MWAWDGECRIGLWEKEKIFLWRGFKICWLSAKYVRKNIAKKRLRKCEGRKDGILLKMEKCWKWNMNTNLPGTWWKWELEWNGMWNLKYNMKQGGQWNFLKKRTLWNMKHFPPLVVLHFTYQRKFFHATCGARNFPVSISLWDLRKFQLMMLWRWYASHGGSIMALMNWKQWVCDKKFHIGHLAIAFRYADTKISQ